MNRLLFISGIMAAGMVVSQANANEERWPRWYVGLTGGVTFLEDDDISGGATGNMDFKTGGMGAISLGYMPALTMQPLSNMRFEAELGYHFNKLDSLTLSGTPTATDGQIQGYSYMGNLYYDFRNSSQFTPYIGGGAGGAHLMLNRTSGLGNTDTGDNVFAYQFMGGIAYAPTTMPATEWNLGYRYFVAQDPTFGSPTGKIKRDDYTAHNVELGGKFRF
jgi:OmpA-OmpF porin, OOP family